MKRSLALLSCAALISISTFPAQAAGLSAGEVLKVNRAGDTELECGALSREALRMRNIVQSKQVIQDNSETKGYGISAAGAVGSLLIGTLTGGIGFAAAGFLATEAVDSESDAADRIQDIAEERRGFMIGIYNAKGCYGPIEHTLLKALPADETTRMAAATSPSAGNGSESPALPKKYYNE